MTERGIRQVEIAEFFNTSQSVISRTLTRFRQTGVASRRPGSGARRVTTPREDRFLIIQARRQPFATAPQHLQSLSNATGTRISNQTVRNQLREDGLTSYRPLSFNKAA
ncbi:HTH 29 domain containing protein [Asbolus verrucosus]|uniref:HTH 29 domain containing protein n=1 Tax=Asbolus verrucosus TaxID=1661398 RepID=A0A482VVJ5_ASBVE|nr:HTH 29 domain containing protein [Asbolus verrucosus]